MLAPAMLLLCFFVAHVLLTFVWRSVIVRRRTGIDPLVLPARDDAFGYVGRAFKVVMLCIGVVILTETLTAQAWHRFGDIEALDGPVLRSVGWALLWISLGWIVLAQVQMGNAWRIGIDERRKTELITGGLFACSRNPIFLGLRITMVGLLLVLPCGATLAMAAAAELLMQVQVRLEEAHLASSHGERYAAYARRVRRWL